MLINTSGKKVIDMLEVNLGPPNKDCRLNQLLIVRELSNLVVDGKYGLLEIGLVLDYLDMFVKLSAEGQAWGPGFSQLVVSPLNLKGPMDILREDAPFWKRCHR